jgi:amidase
MPVHVEPGSYWRATQQIPRPLRIGLVLREPGGGLPDAEIGAAVEAVGRELARAGHVVTPFEFPASTAVGDAAALIWMTAISEDIEHHIPLVGQPPQREDLDFVTYESWQRGLRWRASDYVAARRVCSAATGALVEAMTGLDLLLLPTTATLPPKTGEIDGRTGAMSIETWGAAAYAYAPYTELFNITGMPAISVPLAESASGLPIGIQLVAPLGMDARLLSMAAWLERAMPWDQRLAKLRQRWC